MYLYIYILYIYTGTATILNDDSPRVSIVSSVNVTEGNTFADFTVTLTLASYEDILVPYATSSINATAGDDYQSASVSSNNTTTTTFHLYRSSSYSPSILYIFRVKLLLRLSLRALSFPSKSTMIPSMKELLLKSFL